jgi:TonB family protein
MDFGRRHRFVAILCVGMALSLARSRAQSAAAVADDDLGQIAAERWVGRALILRGFPAADELKYDAAGHPQGSGKVTDWTLAGFDLEKVSRRADGDLQLNGVRVAIRYNPEQHTFDRHPLKDEKMRIEFPAAAVRGVGPALAAMFSVGIDPALERSMPPYWSHYFIPSLEWPADGLTGQTIVGQGGKTPEGVVYPELEKKLEPGFTPEASADHVRGTVQVRMDVDAQGVPQRIVVRQPLGYGLDARTVETVGRYRFRPGMLSGAPVAMEMTVNQAFE